MQSEHLKRVFIIPEIAALRIAGDFLLGFSRERQRSGKNSSSAKPESAL